MPYFILMYSKSGPGTLFYSSLYKGLVYNGYTIGATEGLSKTLSRFEKGDTLRKENQHRWVVKVKIPMTLME